MQQREHHRASSSSSSSASTEVAGAVAPAPTAAGTWTASATMLNADTQRVQIRDASQRLLSYSEVVALWRDDPAFAAFYSATLKDSPFDSFFWEIPPTTQEQHTATKLAFEHVTVKAHGFSPADPSAFSEHLRKCETSGAMVTEFDSLGGDAVLVAPCERGPRTQYAHLGAFVREASAPQQAALWKAVGHALKRALANRGDSVATWLSTEGSGVPWLHIRLDSRPKYYHHAAYRAKPRE